MKILVMGVSGCGKSTFGRALADTLGLDFFDADDFHSPEAVAKMTTGKPLNDQDRLPWLQNLARLLAEHDALVLACSALKRSYRDLLRQAAPELRTCYLHGEFSTILERMEQRQAHEGHFFGGIKMLKSQFETLEEPQEDEIDHKANNATGQENETERTLFKISVEQSLAEQLKIACQRLNASPKT